MINSCSSVKIFHNLANDDHFQFILRSLGGKQLLMKRYPELYKILLYTQEKQRSALSGIHRTRGMPSPSASNDDYIYGTFDSMKIRTLNYDPKTTLESVSSIQTVDANPSLIIIGEVTDVTHRKSIDGFAVYDSDSQVLDGSIHIASPSLIKDTEYEFLAKSTFSKIDYDEEGKPFYYSVTDITDAKKVMAAGTLVKGITINDPLPIKHEAAAQTVVYYNNRKGSGCDYYYNNVKNDGKSVEVYIPFKGTVEFAPGFKPLYVDRNLDFMLQIETARNGTAAFHTGHWNEIKFSTNASSLSWEFPERWYDILQKNNFGAANNVGFYCKMYVALSGGISVPIVISSEDREHQDPSFKRIPKLTIEWGCFAKGTWIRMGDGSLKKIDDIKAGDLVKTDNGIATVSELVVGTEQKMVLIRTSNSRTLTVTADHPIKTIAGWKKAGDLNAADILQTEAGPSAIEELHYVDYADTVFGIRLDAESALIAQGIYAGDFGCQNRLAQQPEAKPSTKREAFQQELSDLIASVNSQLRKE